MRIFIDTSPLIYLIEGQGSVSDSVEVQISSWIRADETIATSTLTMLELLVVPKKNNDRHLVQKYRALLKDLVSEPLIPLSEIISEQAAEIRGRYGFKTPDSIQLASAVYFGADIFYSNDLRLGRFPDLKVLSVNQDGFGKPKE